jgi:hypothetical protein
MAKSSVIEKSNYNTDAYQVFAFRSQQQDEYEPRYRGLADVHAYLRRTVDLFAVSHPQATPTHEHADLPEHTPLSPMSSYK